MNKIKLKLKSDYLKTIIEAYYEEMPELVPLRVNKAVQSISDELMVKLEKKLITKRNEISEFKMTIKYHEAFALLEIAKRQALNPAGEYEANIYRILIMQLDRQL